MAALMPYFSLFLFFVCPLWFGPFLPLSFLFCVPPWSISPSNLNPCHLSCVFSPCVEMTLQYASNYFDTCFCNILRSFLYSIRSASINVPLEICIHWTRQSKYSNTNLMTYTLLLILNPNWDVIKYTLYSPCIIIMTIQQNKVEVFNAEPHKGCLH